MARNKMAPKLRTPKRRGPGRRQREYVPNSMADVLAQTQRSGRIHFVKALPKTAIQDPTAKQAAKLELPLQFVEENGERFEQLVTLRVQISPGRRSSKSWPVRVCIASCLKVQIVGGWPAFASDNGLRRGDFVVFSLRENAKSEFVVHVFRGPRGAPYFPDHPEGRSDDDNEDDEEEPESEKEVEEPESEREGRAKNQSRLVSPNQALSRDARIGNSAPLQHPGNPGVHPCFTKRLAAWNIGRSSGQCKTAQFEFPVHFVRSHGDRIHGFVKLQGIHEDSINYVMYCHRRPRNLSKAYFTPTEWSRFVDDNGLKEGQELQFSLMADSYFVVRKISG